MERLTADLTEDHLMEVGGRGVKKNNNNNIQNAYEMFLFCFLSHNLNVKQAICVSTQISNLHTLPN